MTLWSLHKAGSRKRPEPLIFRGAPGKNRPLVYGVQLAGRSTAETMKAGLARKLLLASGRGAPGKNRTCDQRFRKPLLYPLSYGGQVGAGTLPRHAASFKP